MRRAVCLLLVIALVLSLAIPSFANEIEEPQYGAINVEYTDAIGSIERLDVMVQDSYLYADANMLSARLGYKCLQEGNVVSIYANNDLFSHNVPLLAVHFRANSTDVSYNPMFGAEYQYTAPAPCIVNEKGIWVPLAYTLVLLGGNSTALKDTLLIQMPQENVLSVAALITNNEQYLSFDWVDDFGYSETTTDVTNGAARIVTLFSGLLEFDGAAWLSLVDWSAFDRKFGDLLVTMFCTYSEEELDENILQVETLLDVLSEDGKFGSLLHNKQARLDSDVTAWQTACEEYLNILEDGSGSPAKYNLLYQQYERAMDKQTLFATLGGEGMAHIQDELSSATNVLDIASILSTTVSYLSEFQQKDEYMFSVLNNYLRQRTKTDDLPHGTAQAMQNYLNVMDLGALGYGAYRYIEENWLKCIVDESGLDMVLGAPANVLLFAWDIMSGTIPFYSDGLDAVKNREISNYAQKLQKDALVNLNNLLGELKYSSTISKDDCIRLSEYCYVYLKACYIARATAIKALDNTSEEFQNQIKGKLNTETDINKIIAHYLAILSSADAENRGYILGFLPENNAEYLSDCSSQKELIEGIFHHAQKEKRLTSVIRYTRDAKSEYIFTYNEHGLITEVIGTSPNGGEDLICLQKMIYDSNSRIIELWYPWVEWLSWPKDSYQYSPEGYLLSETHSEGGTSEEVYTLDANGRAMLKTVTFDTGSEIHTYTYDASGRLSQDVVVRSYIDGTTFTDSFSYEYDVQGRLAMAHGSDHGSSSSTSYCYDFKPFIAYTYSATGTANSTTLQIQDCVGHEVWTLYNLYDPHYTVDEAGYVTQITESGYDGNGSTIYFLYNGDTLNEDSITRNTDSGTPQTMDLNTGENSSSDMRKSIGDAILGTWINDMDFEYMFCSDGTYTLNSLVIIGKDTLLMRNTLETGYYEIYNHDTARLYLDGQSYVWTEAVYDFYSDVLIVGGANDVYERSEYKEVSG